MAAEISIHSEENVKPVSSSAAEVAPYFSIIIPVFNIAPYLRECLDSVLIQTFTDWECICVDDGSADGSSAILDEYAAKDRRFKVVHKTNGGVSSARNVGLDIAKGDRIMFLDADDILRESALCDVANAVEKSSDIDFVVYYDVKFIDGASPEWHTVGEVEPYCCDLSKTIPDRLACVCVWGASYRRTVLDGVYFNDCVLGEDLVFFCEVLARAKKCCFLGKAEYANRLRIGSASRSNETYRKICDRIKYHSAMFKTIAASGKNFARSFTHGRGNSWIEELPYLIWKWDDRAERSQLFLLWFESMRLAREMPFFSWWQKFAAGLPAILKSRTLALVLCVLPYKLKTLGFHR